ncbi:DUF11 domain-containing protein [Methanothermobacter sp. DSM 3267]|uniref:DUF11 domain-containing protein n=1 Tax=Methanothermobacter sp. DSM 3267 TaxID=3381696 RepID=UPI003EBAC022
MSAQEIPNGYNGYQGSDLAVDAEYLDLDENIIDTTTVGDEILEGVAVTNLGPYDATGVKVQITRSSPYPMTYLGHEVSWDAGTTWVSGDPSYSPLTDTWTIGNLPKGQVYKLVVHQQATAAGTAQFTAKVSGDQYDQNLTNNQDNATLTVREGSPETSKTEADMIPMQETGVPAGALAAAVSVLAAGLVLSRR